jgi:hypothetical protein
LERGDSASVATGLLNLRNGGFISTNDGLRKLRMNPISEDEGGNIRIIQGANVPLSSLVNWNGATSAFDQKSGKKADDEQEADAERGDLIPDKNAEFRKQIFASYRRLFRDVIGRAINRQQPIADYVRKAIHPVLASMLEAINVVKYGSTSVSESDEQRISSVADQIAGSSGEWRRSCATATPR